MKTLLLISEDKGLQRYLKKILSEEAFNVLEAENLADALKLRLKRQPRLILLDLDLSQEEEFSLLEKLDSVNHESSSSLDERSEPSEG